MNFSLVILNFISFSPVESLVSCQVNTPTNPDCATVELSFHPCLMKFGAVENLTLFPRSGFHCTRDHADPPNLARFA
jgi:hypothetical protein